VHVVRADNLCTSITQGRIAGTKKRGRPRRRWTDDIKDWTELPVAECVRTAQERTAWLWPSTLRNEEEPVQSRPVRYTIFGMDELEYNI